MPISCGDCKYYEEFMPEEDGYDKIKQFNAI